MYFIDEEHERNFERLMDLYNLQLGKSCQYEASIYIASIPDIFKCFGKLENIDATISPLFELCEWNEETEIWEVSAAPLTGSTRRMVEFGLSLYNGYPIGLDDIIGFVTSEEYIKALYQAIEIRAWYWKK